MSIIKNILVISLYIDRPQITHGFKSKKFTQYESKINRLD